MAQAADFQRRVGTVRAGRRLIKNAQVESLVKNEIFDDGTGKMCYTESPKRRI